MPSESASALVEEAGAPAITFDRRSRELTTSGVKAHIQARMMQFSHLALAPLGYFGISRLHAAINKAIYLTSDTLIVEDGVRFRFPSSDYYWNRLLDANWQYEPEIDAFLRAASDIPFVFFDLGANFGYWSTRVGSGLYGAHRSIAVEASAKSFAVLERNVAGLRYAVRTHHRAIDVVSGNEVQLYGARHAGFSIDQKWHGASNVKADLVTSISIDDLLESESVDARKSPVVIKLDVEGAEERAIRGAVHAVRGQSAFLIEDADKNDISEAVRRLHDLGMSLFRFERNAFQEIRDLNDVKGLKGRQNSFRGIGLNLIAASAPVWLNVLRSSERVATKR